MKYLTPFRVISSTFMSSGNGSQRATLAYDDMITIIKTLLSAIEVDDAWYTRAYPDVALAIARGEYGSAQEHFAEHGYFEGRQPYAFEVDEDWYLAQYADVAEGLENGDFDSATEHFNMHGYNEGRRPNSQA